MHIFCLWYNFDINKMKNTGDLILEIVNNIPSLYLWLLFLVVIIIVVVFSFILDYHWRTLHTKLAMDGEKTYFTGLFILILISLASLIIFGILS